METKHCLSKDYVRVANCAAKSGHITTLCWLKENHYAINGYTSIYAARKGHLETVKWLYENTTTVYCADEDDDCEDDTHAPQIAFAAVESGNLELLQYLYGKAPIDYGYVRCAAIERGYLDILRWIPKENGYSTMADAAAEYGHFEVLNLVITNCWSGSWKTSQSHTKDLIYANERRLSPYMCMTSIQRL
jgi:hypothetical protein